MFMSFVNLRRNLIYFFVCHPNARKRKPNSIFSSLTIRDILSLSLNLSLERPISSRWLNAGGLSAPASSSDVVIVKNLGIPAKKQRPVSHTLLCLSPPHLPKLLLSKKNSFQKCGLKIGKTSAASV